MKKVTTELVQFSNLSKMTVSLYQVFVNLKKKVNETSSINSVTIILLNRNM